MVASWSAARPREVRVQSEQSAALSAHCRTLSGRLTQRAHARVACVGVTMLLPRQSIARAASLSYLRAAAPASMAAASPRAGRPSPHLLTLPQAGSAASFQLFPPLLCLPSRCPARRPVCRAYGSRALSPLAAPKPPSEVGTAVEIADSSRLCVCRLSAGGRRRAAPDYLVKTIVQTMIS